METMNVMSESKNIRRKGYVRLEVTSACNLRCRLCFLSRHTARADELTTVELKGLIDQLAEMDIEWLGITGGEPLLRPDIFEIVNYAKQKGLKVKLNTNAMLITDDIVQRLDVDIIHVSVDGLENTNDWNHGAGTFRKIVAAIKLLAKRKMTIYSNTIMTRHNKGELFKLTDMLFGMGVARVAYSRVINTGVCSSVYDDIYLKTQKIICIKLKLVANSIINGYRISFDGGVPGFISGCGISYDYPFIQSNGDVVPCCCFREKPIIGNIRKDSYSDILKEYWRKPFHAPLNPFENCNDCLERLNEKI